MNIPSSNNHYALLALFLSPWKDEETVYNLSEYIQKGSLNWGRILFMANLHFCAPLWFVNLRKDGFLPLLPKELQSYLLHLHQANMERQDALRKAAKEIISNLNHIEIPVILLKGAATFCDDLYEDAGARMMGDLDFLVKVRHIEPVKNLLRQLGYDAQADCFGTSGFFDSSLPHHLPRYLKSGTPVAVEIHFQTAKGQANRVLPTDFTWANKEIKRWEGLNPGVLTPTYRLLHNTVHALVPKEAYTTSIVPLSQLAEFAYLVRRYGSVIDWREWFERGNSQCLGFQFRVYLTLAHTLMGMPYPIDVPRVAFAGLHLARLSGASNNRANYLSGFETPPETAAKRIKAVAVRILIIVFRRMNKPSWVWHNLCYRQGLRNIPIRLYCLSVFFFRRFNFKQTFDFRMLNTKFKKMLYLIKKQ
ncbi:MAG: nucleotidyltransferase family protein [Deltaproteobacteria bacterium]|nr:nucleotidyltransferase family protein [Deltaproteobacteria bacterium]